MPGTDSVPHWFRRALSLLESQANRPRSRSALARARAAAEERRRTAHLEATAGGAGPRELRRLVTAWEEQQARKARTLRG